MDYIRLNNDLEQLRSRIRSLHLTQAGLILALLASLAAILCLAGNERTIVVPPAFERSFWVTRSQASREYLEPMAGFVAWLILDVTPDSIDWKKSVLLNYVAPGQHGALKARQEVAAERLRRINGCTYFLPQQLVADEAKQAVTVRGRLRTLVNGQETSNETKTWLVQFSYSGARLHLTDFREI